MFYSLNIVDYLLIAFLLYSLYDGWRRGIFSLVADIVAIALSILASFYLYQAFAPHLAKFLQIPEQAGRVVAFFLLAFALGNLLSFMLGLTLKIIPAIIRGSLPDKFSGALFGAAKGLLYAGIVFFLISSLPVMQPLKEGIAASRFAPPLTTKAKVWASRADTFLKSRFGGLVEETFAILTIKPGERGLDLGFTTTQVYTDTKAEEAMLELINQERRQRGLTPLKMDRSLREAARAHSRDMLQKGYFSHETPEGKTPAQRLDERGIRYRIMGENLALAPDVQLAHKGLMNSPSHRENILFPEYRAIGIGAINGGIYGIMFSQEFTD
jgi:uncharacterized protein YkwD/uncharacterized membrane protein required for colicin V production